MVRINRVITKTGDDGSTNLYGSGRIRKDSSRVDAMGDVDELIAMLGMLRSIDDQHRVPEFEQTLAQLQNDLFDLGSELAAAPGKQSPCPIKKKQIAFLEKTAERINRKLPELHSFVLPGGDLYNAWLHLARTVARRAERSVVRLSSEGLLNPLLQIYLNRLSDLLFIMARQASQKHGVKEILWKSH